MKRGEALTALSSRFTGEGSEIAVLAVKGELCYTIGVMPNGVIKNKERP